MSFQRAFVLLGSCLLAASCTFKKAELGQAGNPIKLFFTPSVDAKVMDASTKEIKKFLETNTPYKFEISVPQSYIAVVEAFGSKRADIAIMNTFGYILAHNKYGAEAKLTIVRHGQSTYQSQIIVRSKDKDIKDIKDLEGKKIAFVDPASMSGYILPLKMLRDSGVKTGETVFAQKHDSVVSMIYQERVDAGATFYSPKADGSIQDARRLVKTQYPDVEEKIKILKLTDEIPNDPLTFRKEMTEEMKTKVVDALVAYIHTEEGKKSLGDLYMITDFKKASDADYDGVQKMIKDLNIDVSSLMKK